MRRAVRTAAAAAIGAAALIAAAPGTASATLVAPYCDSAMSRLRCGASGSQGPLTWTVVSGTTTTTYQTPGNYLNIACNTFQLYTVSYTDSAGETSGSRSVYCLPGPER